MNLGGHVAVAAHVAPDDTDFWLGSALPDIGAIGRFRLLGATEHPQLAAGIAFHHATDAAFHGHPWFVETQRSLQRALVADGVRRGAARACAHVGPELLLDGQLLTHRSHLDAALDRIEVRLPQLRTLTAADQSEDWAQHLRLVQQRGLPTDYDDPVAVARRLHRILSARPRLAFDANQIDIVAEHLTSVQPDVTAKAHPLVLELAVSLRL